MRVPKACALLLAVAALPAQTSQPTSQPVVADFEGDIRHLTRLVKQNWSYLEYRKKQGLDLDQLEAMALKNIRATPTKVAFLQVLQRYIAGLKDGHACALYGKVPLVGYHRMPFSLADTKEGVMVLGVHGPAHKAGKLRPGDLVLAVDGKDIEQVIRDTERVISASSDGSRRKQAIYRIYRHRWRKKTTVRIRRVDNAKEEDVDLDCPFGNTSVGAHHLLFHKREWKMVGAHKNVAYFRPGNFSPPRGSDWHTAPPSKRPEILAGTYQEFQRTFKAIVAKEPKALIVDLRGNPGGTDLLGKRLAAHLLKSEFIYFKLQARRRIFWGGWGSIHGYGPKNLPKDLARFSGKLVCLLDEGVFSTADNFAACIRDLHPDVTFVGRPTGAGTGAPKWFTLRKTKARVVFCSQRVYSPRGTQIEGIGVQPEVKVQWTSRDYLQKRDPDLEAALELIRAGP